MKEKLEQYMNEGFRWIYKYSPNVKFKNNPNNFTTRIFISEPWFSLEGGMNYVDTDACIGIKDRETSRLVDLDIDDLKEPIKIEQYIKLYLSNQKGEQ